MELPVQTFWAMNSNVGRLLAETDLRNLSVGVSTQSEDNFKSTRETLMKEMGEMFKTNINPLAAERDEEGFQELKTLAALMG